MCLGYPAKIIQTDGKQAWVDYMGVKTSVSVELIEDASPGEYVMIHAGIAIAKMNKSKAKQTLAIFKEMEQMKEGF